MAPVQNAAVQSALSEQTVQPVTREYDMSCHHGNVPTKTPAGTDLAAVQRLCWEELEWQSSEQRDVTWATVVSTLGQGAKALPPSMPRRSPAEEAVVLGGGFWKSEDDCKRLATYQVEALKEEPSEQENTLKAGGPMSLWSDSEKDVAKPGAAYRIPLPPLEFSGRETPVGGDSIPLEWTPSRSSGLHPAPSHMVDVGGSLTYEDAEDVASISALSVTSMNGPTSPRRTALSRKVCSSGFHRQGYVKLMSECSGSNHNVKRVRPIFDGEQEAEGLTSGTADNHTGTMGVIECWEVSQAQDIQCKNSWQWLSADLRDVTSWLDRKLPELEALQKIPPSTGLKAFEDNVRALKEMQKAFGVRKRALISLNLSIGHLRELKAGLGSANRSWMRACGALEHWEVGLRAALMQCQEFHCLQHSLLLWLTQVEQKLGAVSQRQPPLSYAALLEQCHTVEAVWEQLWERQAAASCLHDAGTQLLLRAGPSDVRGGTASYDRTSLADPDNENCVEAEEKVHTVGNEVKLVLRHVRKRLDRDLCALGRHEEGEEPNDYGQAPMHTRERAGGSGGSNESSGHLPVCRPLLQRVLLVVLPLAFAFLVVPSHEWPSLYGGSRATNFALSFNSLLRDSNGHPLT
ncbi:nesprin-2-like isoform X2 [Syngnathus scovelli]|uniref:nesprin-2-like isoform X2 n=1 Tax=Syngnathus scovelli TaxID=161590 RepID=UPI0021100B29|nr:nesprin-2-like isoform X2 [Syngnathus scovelli]